MKLARSLPFATFVLFSLIIGRSAEPQSRTFAQVRALEYKVDSVLTDSTTGASAPTSCTEGCAAATDPVVKDCCACYCKEGGSYDPVAMRTCMADKGVGHCDAAPAEAPVTSLVGTVAPPTRAAGPSYPCSPMKRLAANMYRCGDFCLWLKDAFPSDLTSTPAHEAVIKLRERNLIEKEIQSKMGDFVLAGAPNDPHFSDQTAVNGTAAADIGALDAWSVLTGSSSVVVAMIDSGANVSHPDLQANIWTNPGETANGTDDDGNGFVDDLHGFDFAEGDADVSDPVNHGTEVAGVIGAVGNNGVGVAGVNWNVKLLPLKFTDSAGTGSLTTALAAIDYAIDKGAKVINASFVMDLAAGDPAKVATLQDAVQKAIDAGIVFVAAAGNNFSGAGANIDAANVFPAALPVEPILSVAAVDSSGALASFSNFGPGAVDLAAPGVSIVSTSSDGDYSGTKGTSIATPFVSGAAALLFSFKPSFTPADIKSILTSTARPLSGLSGKVASGGTLDLRAALVSVGALSASAASSAPAAAPTTVASAEKTSSAPSSGGGCSLLRPPY